MGHASDAVDAYQVTSEEQRKKINNILTRSEGVEVVKDEKLNANQLQVEVRDRSKDSNMSCRYGAKSFQLEV